MSNIPTTGPLTVMEAAKIMRCSEDTVLKMIKDGLLVSTKPCKKHLISRESVNKHLPEGCKA
jgi:excisionase family DNA binding protein